jgi:hypothetical protein
MAAAFRLSYLFLRLLDPLIRLWLRAYGLGNVVELVVPGRRTGRRRSTLLGLLSVDGTWYVGHPNGPVAWTRNLDAAGGRAELRWRGTGAVPVGAVRLPPGEERERAILATDQHPFPADLIYRLGRSHVRAAGVYYRLEVLRD